MLQLASRSMPLAVRLVQTRPKRRWEQLFVSSALALTRAVSPVTPPDIARPATDLADAYSAFALSAYADGKPDPSAVVAATAAMRQACG